MGSFVGYVGPKTNLHSLFGSPFHLLRSHGRCIKQARTFCIPSVASHGCKCHSFHCNGKFSRDVRAARAGWKGWHLLRNANSGDCDQPICRWSADSIHQVALARHSHQLDPSAPTGIEYPLCQLPAKSAPALLIYCVAALFCWTGTCTPRQSDFALAQRHHLCE